jgi:hypothetical protein
MGTEKNETIATESNRARCRWKGGHGSMELISHEWIRVAITRRLSLTGCGGVWTIGGSSKRATRARERETGTRGRFRNQDPSMVALAAGVMQQRGEPAARREIGAGSSSNLQVQRPQQLEAFRFATAYSTQPTSIRPQAPMRGKMKSARAAPSLAL